MPTLPRLVRAAFSSRPLVPRSDAGANTDAAVSDAVVRLVAAGGSSLEADLDRLFPILSQYYNVLVAAKCKAGDFAGARELFDEMRRAVRPGLQHLELPYLLGCLLKKGRLAEACSLVEDMDMHKPGKVPNSLTYEILTHHACRAGKMDPAMRILDQKFSANMMPRITIHTAFIKGYFYAGRIEDACKYFGDMSTRDMHSANRNYSLLAKLLQKSGRTIDAGKVLCELKEKGLSSDHSAYVKVTKDLHKMDGGSGF